VEFVGADVPTDRLDRHRWRAWVRHLRSEVEEGRVAVNTARVIYSRAREFGSWVAIIARLPEGLNAQGLPARERVGPSAP
jgi:hypothetical protein